MPDDNITDAVEFVDNPEPRCPCVLVLDRSTSMTGQRIDSLNEAIAVFRDEVCQDALTAMRAEVAIVAYSHEITVVQDFVNVSEFNPPVLTADGGTCIAGAVRKALDMLEERKQQYKANAIEYYRPIMILVTDGFPEHDTAADIHDAARRIREGERDRNVACFAFGVESADMNMLASLMSETRPPKQLQSQQLKGVFQWLANSVSAISQSQPGDRLRLPPQDPYLDF